MGTYPYMGYMCGGQRTSCGILRVELMPSGLAAWFLSPLSRPAAPGELILQSCLHTLPMLSARSNTDLPVVPYLFLDLKSIRFLCP